MLTERWARDLLMKIGWSKRKGTTGKVVPPALLLKEELFSFQRDIAQAVYDHDIPKRLIFNIDQTPLSYVSPGKCTFHAKGAPHVPIKGVDDKRQITATFMVNAAGEFFSMQLIYTGITKRYKATVFGRLSCDTDRKSLVQHGEVNRLFQRNCFSSNHENQRRGQHTSRANGSDDHG